MDIFKDIGITDANGNPLTEDNLNPLMGYIIKNKYSDKMLPQTTYNNIMGSDYAMKKFIKVMLYYMETNIEFPFHEYEYVPVYFLELFDLNNFVLLYTDTDEKEFGLFS